MHIAILAPSPVPYTIGGAEYLWWGLLETINAAGEHQADLIKIPSPDRSLGELIQSYRRFAELDLDHFDLVISTKYPAWMISHPNHVVYLQHKLRGLYDTYPAHLPTALPDAADLPAAARPLIERLANGPARREELPALWEELAALEAVDPALTEIPGPLVRAVVHYLDRIGLQPPAIQRYLAISENVTRRKDYFPVGVPVEVVHHPSHREPEPAMEVDSGDDNGNAVKDKPILFTASRLDSPKRLDLLIRAFRRIKADAELHIAGTGPVEAELQRLAAGDPRIRLLGWQSDAAIAEGYRRAAFVPFIPYDEDYGLITIEAMQVGRAVLTTTDAGGVNEFVVDGETGRSVEPTESALAAAMQDLLADPAATAAMGDAARAKVADIGWPQTVDALINPSAQRPRLVVATTFPVFPPMGGGPSRIYHLYRELSRWADITLVTLTGEASEAGTYPLGPGYREVRVAKSRRQRLQEQVMGRRLKASVDDIVAMDNPDATPALREALTAACQNADLVVASHHYLYPLIRSVWRGPLWYEAHNLEAEMKAAVLAPALEKGSAAARRALARVEAVERDCARDADCVLAVSAEEREALVDRYGIDRDKVLLAPNGTDTQAIAYTDPAQRRVNQQAYGVEGRFTALFMGSWHGPNIDAVWHIAGIAAACPGMDFLLMGNVCDAPLGELPPNCYRLGRVSEAEKRRWLATADCALNPMTSGAGSNLKLVEYAAAGLPVITTPFGNRGVGLKANIECLEGEVRLFPDILARLRAGEPHAGTQLVEKARRRVTDTYDWGVVAVVVREHLPLPAGTDWR
ncbi:glycosyltransferase family 4 protein [Spiribacter aquaticus]|uniref:Glycosyltransferase family 4 protein n=1 Tax=Spiribacter aquaticus TaxID=1935996 RepID=A0A557RLS3_9GAMM|nr:MULTISPECIES: glycosyltransferase family 4 protein [Spiribacter]KAF0279169.1 hypothetical protein BA897_00150 [Spiribacter roseus]TVO66131.1 glycosyltransferase family 4 protein [Spiribacter aquaticus]